MRTALLWTLLVLVLSALPIAACGGDDDDSASDDDVADDDVDDDIDDDDADDDEGDDDTWPPLPDDDAADDDAYDGPPILPGPDQEGYDADLEDLARMYDRQFHTFNAWGMGVNADVTVNAADTADRELIRAFLQDSDGWDFEAHSGKAPEDVVDAWHKVAGLYGGVGLAADAFRYGVLRDQGYPQEEVDIAREHLVAGLEALHIAHAITGVPGVIARGFHKKTLPGFPAYDVQPLFDGEGNPLPPEKNNGTWREDNSPGGDYPDYLWEDSCSRDQFIGWCAASAAAWEVIRDDDTFDEALKDRLQEDARLIGLSLAVVRESGFDLEIFDADGRTTYHGYMNENNYDRLYLPFIPIKNGMYSAMALGCVAALAYTAEDDELTSYLMDTLVGQRRLHEIAAGNQLGVDLWWQTNYSAVNMAFQGAHLAIRYLPDDAVRAYLRYAIDKKLYFKQGFPRQVKEQKASLFDFMYASGVAGSTAFHGMTREPDGEAVARGVETLLAYDTPPYWAIAMPNCDDAELAAHDCLAVDGVTHITPIGNVGRNDSLIAVEPTPKHVRPKSNYEWRSNPYSINGDGDGSGLLPGVDFRYAYWLGRWSR